MANIDAADFVILLGHYEGEPFLDNFLSQFGAKPDFDTDGTHIGYLEYKESGFCLYFREEKMLVEKGAPFTAGRYILTNLMFNAEGFQGYKDFKGNLPGGIVFSDNREKVRQKLGEPFATGGGGKSRTLGPLPETDLYKLPDIDALMIIRYSLDKTRIDQVTLTKEQYRK